MPRYSVHLRPFDEQSSSGIGGEYNADNAVDAAKRILDSWDHPRMSHNLVGYDPSDSRTFHIIVTLMPAEVLPEQAA